MVIPILEVYRNAKNQGDVPSKKHEKLIATIVVIWCILTATYITYNCSKSISEKELVIVRFLSSQNSVYQTEAIKRGTGGVINQVEYHQLFRYVRPY